MIDEALALDQAATSAQCYPYFIQIVGRELHRSAEAEPDKLLRGIVIGDAIFDQALKVFRSARNAYYAHCYNELGTSSVFASAEAVAQLFVAQKTTSISANEIKAAVVRSIDSKLEERAKANGGIEPTLWVEDKLRKFGFIWSQFGNEDRCEPGNPGLMNYVMERANYRESAPKQKF